jgi:hypothetical protein
LSLGVLNNVTALYAENALSRTSNRLSAVLQQLKRRDRFFLKRAREVHERVHPGDLLTQRKRNEPHSLQELI